MRIHDIILSQIRAIDFVRPFHQRQVFFNFGMEREKVIIDNTGGAVSQGESPLEINGDGWRSAGLTRMVIKPQKTVGMVREITKDVLIGDRYAAIHDILYQDDGYFVDLPNGLEQRCRDDTVQVSSNYCFHSSMPEKIVVAISRTCLIMLLRIRISMSFSLTWHKLNQIVVPSHIEVVEVPKAKLKYRQLFEDQN